MHLLQSGGAKTAEELNWHPSEQSCLTGPFLAMEMRGLAVHILTRPPALVVDPLGESCESRLWKIRVMGSMEK